jgi:uncharacterized protein YozE (UPF0346 family)
MNTLNFKFACQATVIACIFLTIIFTAKMVTAHHININSDVIDQKYFQSSEGKFTISDDGAILSGPVRYEGDPIDYSEIIKDDILFSLFRDVLLECREQITLCRDGFFRRSSKDLKIKIFTAGSILVASDFDDISSAIEHSLDVAGFPVVAENVEQNADIVLYVGELDYLWRKSRENKSVRVTRSIEEQIEQTSKFSVSKVFSSANEHKNSCFVSNESIGKRIVTQVYIHADSIKTCLSRVFLTSIGLHSTDSGLPTMTDRLSRFRSLTFADLLFTKILYHDDFGQVSGFDELRIFWNENIPDLRNEINAD